MGKCEHKNIVTDYHEGTLVCLDCSFVVDSQLYIDETKTSDNYDDCSKNDFKEILTRLNCSYNILETCEIKKVSDLYNKLNTTNTVSLKEFCAATGLNTKAVVKSNKETITLQNVSEMLEKYCKLFDLDYKNYTVIKEKLFNKPHSGHPPLTIIGYHIYVFMKTELKRKITIKDICNALGISSISLQRYRRYELSLRS